MLDPHVMAWALDRLKQKPQGSAELAACLRGIPRAMRRVEPSQRVLQAEPISTIIGLTALISGIGVSTAVAGAIGGAIVGVAISVGVNYAIGALTSKPGGAGPIDPGIGETAINSPAIKYNERQAIPSKRILYGTVQVGGALFFEQVKPPFLYQGFLICAKKISAFRGMWIGTQQLAFASMAPGSILSPLAVLDQPNFPGRLQVSFRLGDANQAIDPLLAANFPALSSEFRQRGIATAVVRYDYGADSTEYTALWGQAARPNPLWLVDGIAIPDPRNPAHILNYDPSDAAATLAAEASWSFGNNATLVQAHYLSQRFGGRIDPRRMNWDKVTGGADWDDGLIACNDGSFIKRHTIDGVVTLNQPPSTVISAMLSANRGRILESAGRVWAASSPPLAPNFTIHDGLLTGPVEYRAAKPKRDLANRVKVRFVAADREYQVSDGPVLARADLKLADGELLDATVELPFTMDHRRAQRLQKAFLETARLGRQVSVRCDVAMLAECGDELVGSVGNFSSVLFAQANGLYLCTDWGFSDNFSSIDLSLSEYDPTIETDYRAVVDEQAFTLAPLDLS